MSENIIFGSKQIWKPIFEDNILAQKCHFRLKRLKISSFGQNISENQFLGKNVAEKPRKCHEEIESAQNQFYLDLINASSPILSDHDDYLSTYLPMYLFTPSPLLRNWIFFDF